MWSAIRDGTVDACEWLCGFLVPVGDWIKSHLSDVPMWSVRVALGLAFLSLAVWSFRLSKEYVMEGAQRFTWWNDPRRWASVLLIILIGLYLTL
jgi:hypothetical protein